MLAVANSIVLWKHALGLHHLAYLSRRAKKTSNSCSVLHYTTRASIDWGHLGSALWRGAAMPWVVAINADSILFAAHEKTAKSSFGTCIPPQAMRQWHQGLHPTLFCVLESTTTFSSTSSPQSFTSGQSQRPYHAMRGWL